MSPFTILRTCTITVGIQCCCLVPISVDLDKQNWSCPKEIYKACTSLSALAWSGELASVRASMPSPWTWYTGQQKIRTAGWICSEGDTWRNRRTRNPVSVKFLCTGTNPATVKLFHGWRQQYGLRTTQPDQCRTDGIQWSIWIVRLQHDCSCIPEKCTAKGYPWSMNATLDSSNRLPGENMSNNLTLEKFSYMSLFVFFFRCWWRILLYICNTWLIFKLYVLLT